VTYSRPSSTSRGPGKCTDRRLRLLLFEAIRRALDEHYGDLASIKCLQASAALQGLLADLGFGARSVLGWVCASQVFDGSDQLGFAGFWGRDHHTWIETEFGEFADFTISLLHRHPSSSRPDALPLHPVWWTKPREVFPCLVYRRLGYLTRRLSPEEEADLVDFQACARRTWSDLMEIRDGSAIQVTMLLEGEESLNFLHERGDPWSTRSLALLDCQENPLPPAFLATPTQQALEWIGAVGLDDSD